MLRIFLFGLANRRKQPERYVQCRKFLKKPLTKYKRNNKIVKKRITLLTKGEFYA
jgi:hypothetical protein